MAVVFGLALITTLVIALGLPSNLLGSAPREQLWTATPAEVSVVDGETLRLRDRTVRLIGLDAPKRGEACRARDGRSFDCGAAAAGALARMVAGQDLSCRIQGHDSFGRGLARCEAGGTDVNAALVGAGYAIAESRAGLAAKESEARTGERGLWGPGMPEAWRARR